MTITDNSSDKFNAAHSLVQFMIVLYLHATCLSHVLWTSWTVCLINFYSWKLLFIFLPFLCIRFVHKPLQYFKVHGIPGPKPKPIIGNLDLIKKYAVSEVDEFRKNFNLHNTTWFTIRYTSFRCIKPVNTSAHHHTVPMHTFNDTQDTQYFTFAR